MTVRGLHDTGDARHLGQGPRVLRATAHRYEIVLHRRPHPPQELALPEVVSTVLMDHNVVFAPRSCQPLQAVDILEGLLPWILTLIRIDHSGLPVRILPGPTEIDHGRDVALRLEASVGRWDRGRKRAARQLGRHFGEVVDPEVAGRGPLQHAGTPAWVRRHVLSLGPGCVLPVCVPEAPARWSTIRRILEFPSCVVHEILHRTGGVLPTQSVEGTGDFGPRSRSVLVPVVPALGARSACCAVCGEAIQGAELEAIPREESRVVRIPILVRALLPQKQPRRHDVLRPDIAAAIGATEVAIPLRHDLGKVTAEGSIVARRHKCDEILRTCVDLYNLLKAAETESRYRPELVPREVQDMSRQADQALGSGFIADPFLVRDEEVVLHAHALSPLKGRSEVRGTQRLHEPVRLRRSLDHDVLACEVDIAMVRSARARCTALTNQLALQVVHLLHRLP
mmetsp:Transcript_117767/g.340454  ORF Transcript_117767/g.340454 Transcript_117767/m.340454 type:complete len:453 (-) Transcript_117767:259-1617(-)